MGNLEEIRGRRILILTQPRLLYRELKGRNGFLLVDPLKQEQEHVQVYSMEPHMWQKVAHTDMHALARVHATSSKVVNCLLKHPLLLSCRRSMMILPVHVKLVIVN